MITELALSAGYASFFLWIIGRSSFFRDNVLSNRRFQWLFIIKLAAGFGLYLIYTRYYSDRKYADIFRYYDDSRILFDALREKPWDFFRMLTSYRSNSPELWQYYNEMKNWFNSEMIFNDARTMIRLNTIFRFAAAGTYYPHMIFFGFMGFAGLTALYKIITAEYKNNHVLIAIVLFLTPSILLWTSGVIKEAFLIFAIGYSVYYIHCLATQKKKKLRHIGGLFFCLFCLLNIKSYMLFAILPGLFAWYIIELKKVERENYTEKIVSSVLVPFLVVYAVYFAALYNFAPLITHHPVPELLKNKQEEFNTLAKTENAGSFVEIPQLDDTGVSLVKNAPLAFVFTLSRPHLLEAGNPMMLLAAVENVFIIIMLLINIYFLFGSGNTFHGLSFIVLSILLVLTLFCLIGWVTPILGAVVRYKVAALPFLMALLFCNGKWESVNNKIAKLIKAG